MNFVNIYKEACLTLEMIGNFEDKSKKRQHLLSITSIETLNHIMNVKKMLEDMGIQLLIPKN